MRWVLVAGVLAAGAARAEDRPLWKWEQPKAWEVAPLAAATALIWIDVLQSIDARHRGRLEGNFVLGEHPGDAKMYLLGGVLPTLALAAIWYVLPYGWRALPPSVVANVEAFNVWDNARQGFCVRF